MSSPPQLSRPQIVSLAGRGLTSPDPHVAASVLRYARQSLGAWYLKPYLVLGLLLAAAIVLTLFADDAVGTLLLGAVAGYLISVKMYRERLHKSIAASEEVLRAHGEIDDQ